MALQAQIRGSFSCSGQCGTTASAFPAFQSILNPFNPSAIYLTEIDNTSMSFSFAVNVTTLPATQANLDLVVSQIRNVLEAWGVFDVSVGVTSSNIGSGGNVGGSGVYIVQSGDTLSIIARRYGLTLSQLLALNPHITNPNFIQVGQVINVSGTPSGGGTIPVVTNVNPNTGQIGGIVAGVLGGNNNAPATADNRSWFDKTFFTGAGALSGVGIATLVVIGFAVISRNR